MERKLLDNMRDCVNKAFFEGSKRGYEFKKMRHAIILELKRIGYDFSEIKDKLQEWNERCERPLSLGDQRSQLFKYVDWVESRDCRLSCKALSDYCIGIQNCRFHVMITCKRRRQTQNLPLDLQELDKFLTERFKGDGYTMMLVVKALRWVQQEKATGELILIGCRKISSIIRDKFGHNLNTMDIWRKLKMLADERIIECVIRGRAGNFTREANGYRFLPWKYP